MACTGAASRGGVRGVRARGRVSTMRSWRMARGNCARAAAAPAVEAAAPASRTEQDAELFAQRTEREFETWKRQCREVQFKIMREDSLLFDSVSPFETLGVPANASVEDCAKAYAEVKSGWGGITDEDLDRAIWEKLQLYYQDLLLLAQPDYDQDFFFYKCEGEAPATHGWALIRRAHDMLTDKDRRELYFDLVAAEQKGREWESEIKQVLAQIPEEDVTYADPMFEGDDPMSWIDNV